MVVAVAKHQRADEHAPLTLAHDRVPHRGRVAGALDPVPGQRRRPSDAAIAGLHELALGGDLTRGRVDEERGHRHDARPHRRSTAAAPGPSSACWSSTASSAPTPTRVLEDHEVARLLDRIPATTPLELRDRAMFELAYACGLRAEELVTLDLGSIDFDAEQVRVEGKGGKTRFVPPGEPAAARACSATSSAAAPRCWRRARSASRRCSSPRPGGGSRRATSGAACGSGRGTRRPRARSIRTRCGTPSPPICWRGAPTCAPSRSCSDTQPSPRPRSTLG